MAAAAGDDRPVLLFARWLPETLYGRATGWMDPSAIKARNRALVALLVEVVFSVGSLPLGVFRGGLSRISAILNVCTAIAAALGAVGTLRCEFALMWMHSVLVWGVIGIFCIFAIVTIAIAPEPEDTAIIFLVFAFFAVDLVVGCFTFTAGWRLRSYKQRCEAEDAAAGGEAGAGVREREADVARSMLQGLRRAEDAGGHSSGGGASTGSSMGEGEASARVIERAHLAVRAPTTVAPPSAPSATAPAASATAPSSSSSAASDAEAGAPLCPVCLDRPRDSAFVDCGHSACSQCCAAVKARFGVCFLCRKPIKKVIRVYMH